MHSCHFVQMLFIYVIAFILCIWLISYVQYKMCQGELINPLVKLFCLLVFFCSVHSSTGQSHTFTIIGLFEAISQQSIFSELLISARIVFIHVIFLSRVCFNKTFLCNFNTVFVSNFVDKYIVQYGFSQSGHLQPTT